MSVYVEVSVGELLDKISILQIKSERIADQSQLENIKVELSSLLETWKKTSFSKVELTEELAQIREVNETLWELEDNIRIKEASQSFDAEFVRLARSVYVTNDQRSEIKRRINKKLGSALVEEKSYSNYKKT
jgi:hypothetical protein